MTGGGWKNSSDDELVGRYVDAAAKRLQATLDGDHRRGNRAHDKLAKAYRELRARRSRQLLLPLLDHQDLGVRSWAAAHALEFAEAEGLKATKQLAESDPGIVGFNAEMVLREWSAGRLRFP